MSTDNNHFFRTETFLAAAEARKRKAERTKHLGEPLNLPAKPLDILVRGNEIWIAQSDAVVRRISLESGSTVQVYKGHTAPVTSIAFLESADANSRELFLVSGSWDKTVKIWNTKDKSVISSTEAHSDFAKCITSVPELELIITSGSDKVVRFWDISNAQSKQPLKSIGIISAHSRPVQCISIDARSPSSATLYTADTMGVIRVWEVDRTYGDSPNCRATQKEEITAHRTGINDMWFGQGQLWTASSDDTVLLTKRPISGETTQETPIKLVPPITHPTAVKALLPLFLTDLEEPLLITASGDVLRLYDISDPAAPELLSMTDAHWHDVVALRLWIRRRPTEDGKTSIEPWIISASLDQTIRRWRLADLVSPPKEPPKQEAKQEQKPAITNQLTAEEEAELAELMDDDN